MSQQPQQISAAQPAAKNSIGTAGFIVSLVSYITCGMLSPIGVVLSFIGLFKKPRGLAIAGLILGLIGSFGGLAVIGAVGGGSLATYLGLTEFAHVKAERALMEQAMNKASAGIYTWSLDHDGKAPDELDGAATIEMVLAEGPFQDWNVAYKRVSDDEYRLTIIREDDDLMMRMKWNFDAETGKTIRKSLDVNSGQ
jgi:hypothetical protein